jgi:3-hydroxybutyryl-CoA dehydrogenase
MTSLQTIGVIGAGTMGSGIAQACAVVGLSVTIIDVDETAVARGRSAVSSEPRSAGEKGEAVRRR